MFFGVLNRLPQFIFLLSSSQTNNYCKQLAEQGFSVAVCDAIKV